MTTRKAFLASTVLVAVGVLWYLFRPDALLISKTVNEAFPAAEPAAMAAEASTGDAAMSHAMMNDSSAMGAMNHTREARSPEVQPEGLLRGRFHSNAHETKGVATIYRLDDGRRVLRLTGFSTSNGPDVRVYLVAAGDVKDESAAKQAGFVDLGAMKGNIGDQNYDIPAELDLDRYRAVSIWCRRFSVNFGAAPLGPTS